MDGTPHLPAQRTGVAKKGLGIIFHRRCKLQRVSNCTQWKPRERGAAIVQMKTATHVHGERFFLRILISTTSFLAAEGTSDGALVWRDESEMGNGQGESQRMDRVLSPPYQLHHRPPKCFNKSPQPFSTALLPQQLDHGRHGRSQTGTVGPSTSHPCQSYYRNGIPSPQSQPPTTMSTIRYCAPKSMSSTLPMR